MRIPLYQRVALRHNVEQAGLRAGDIATLVDYVPHPQGGEEGCILEVFNALGESIHMVMVPASAIEPLRADEVMSVRLLASTA